MLDNSNYLCFSNHSLFLLLCRLLKVLDIGKDILEKHPDANDVKEKMLKLQDEQKNLLTLWQELSRNLEESNLCIQKFKDFEQWIDAQMVFACSEDFGQDNEQLQVSGTRVLEFLCNFVKK